MNPVLDNKTFETSQMSGEVMTKSGVINKSFCLWAILSLGAYLGWSHPAMAARLLLPMVIGTFVLAMIIVFKKHLAPVLSPIYAFCEGMLLGCITLVFEKSYPGIAVNAIFLTVCVLFCMLAAFKAGFIKPTNKFYAIVGVSTLAIALLYIADMIITIFGGVGFSFITSSSTFGILFSIFVVLIASLNLIIDFDIIQKGIYAGAPKYMEWYGSFALMVTIVWVYIEILRLLSKLRR